MKNEERMLLKKLIPTHFYKHGQNRSCIWVWQSNANLYKTKIAHFLSLLFLNAWLQILSLKANEGLLKTR